jgi:hypothetical protein
MGHAPAPPSPFGGAAALIATPTVEYADSDVGFRAPTIEVDTSTHSVQLSCPSRSDGEAFWEGRLALQMVNL